MAKPNPRPKTPSDKKVRDLSRLEPDLFVASPNLIKNMEHPCDTTLNRYWKFKLLMNPPVFDKEVQSEVCTNLEGG